MHLNPELYELHSTVETTVVMRRACKAISFYLEREHVADAMLLGAGPKLNRVSVQPYNKIDK